MHSGLHSREGYPIPIVNVEITGRVVDFLAEITVTQTYCHYGRHPVEATFKYPLDLFGALCDFKVKLDDGKEIRSEVKKREHTLGLSQAVISSNGDDSEENQPNLFYCSIGSLAPKQNVTFTLTFVAELPMEGNALRFVIPSSTLSPNYRYDKLRKMEMPNPYSLSVNLDLLMPFEIEAKGIQCPTHEKFVTITEQKGNRAIVNLKKENATLEANFVLLVSFNNPHTPRSLVEIDSDGSCAVVLSFFPKFEIKEKSCELIILIDCSNSMGGVHMEKIKSALHILLGSLSSERIFFNIIEFGEEIRPLFPESVSYNNATLEKAKNRVKDLDAESGATHLFDALSYIYQTPRMKPNMQRQIFVFTDGQVSNGPLIFSLVNEHCLGTNVFAFGIGDIVNHYTVEGLARAGCGEAEFVTNNELEQETLAAKVVRQLKRAMQPVLTDINLQWNNFEANDVIQAPKRLRPIFNGDRLLAYGFLKPNFKEGTVKLTAKLPEGPISFSVQVDPATATQGRLVHALAARTRIKDLEDRVENQEEIIKLGTRYGVASKYTSFVAVETEEVAKQGKFNLHNSMELERPRETSPIKETGPIVSMPGVKSPTKPKTMYTATFLLQFQHTPAAQLPLPEELLRTWPEKVRVLKKMPGTPSASPHPVNHNNKGSQPNSNNNTPRKGQNAKSPKTPQQKGKNKPVVVQQEPEPTPVAPLVATAGRWERPKTGVESDPDVIFRKAQGILNRLTIEKFDVLYEKLLTLNVFNAFVLKGIIKQVFDKSVSEPHFCSMYAELCKRLSETSPSLPDENGKEVNFKRLLLLKCQEEFENKNQKPTFEPNIDPQEREELETRFKLRTLGNIKFIGHLFMKRLLAEKVMHEVISGMLKDLENPNEDDIEAVCKLVWTIGGELESRGSTEALNSYFEKFESLSQNENVPVRLRFKLKDVIDLRLNEWVPRRKENDPKTIAAARAEAASKDEEAQNLTSPARPSPARTGSVRESPQQPAYRPSPNKPSTPTTPIQRTPSKEQVPSHLSKSNSRDQLRSSNGAGKPNVKYAEKKSPSANSTPSPSAGWETQGRGKSKKPDRPIYTAKKVEEPKKELRPVVKGNSFSALPEEEKSVSSPRSALKRSNSEIRKGVTIQEPKSEEQASPEQLAEKLELILEEFLSSTDLEEAALCLEELKAPADFNGEVVSKAISLTFEKKERDRLEMTKLFAHLFKSKLFSAEDFEKGFCSLLEIVDDIDIDIPFASKYLGFFIGRFIMIEGALTLSFLENALADLVGSGKASQIVTFVLSTILDEKDEDVLVEMCKSSHFDLPKLLPRNKNIEDYLDNSNLTCLLPLYCKGISSDPSLEQVITLQSADGKWKLDDELATVLGFEVADVENSMPASLKDQKQMWATILALEFLDLHFGDQEDEWSLVADKSLKALETSGFSLADLKQKARSFLQS